MIIKEEKDRIFISLGDKEVETMGPFRKISKTELLRLDYPTIFLNYFDNEPIEIEIMKQ